MRGARGRREHRYPRKDHRSVALPPPLDTALHKLWGFASEQGRHIQEGREPRFEEAELVVTVASAVSVYLLRASGRAR